MANTDFVRGLVPLNNADSGPYNDGTKMFFVPASDATALYIGDPVVYAGSADAGGVATVTRAAAAGPITGVVVGFVPNGTTDTAGHRAASTAAYVLVETNANATFEIQDTAGAVTAADVGTLRNLTINAGNAFTKRSGVVLGGAGAAVRVLGLRQMPGNEFGAFAKVMVKIAAHTDGSAVPASI